MNTAISTNPYMQMCPAFTPGQPHLHPYIIDQVTEKCHQAATELFQIQWQEGLNEDMYQTMHNSRKISLIFDRAYLSLTHFMSILSSYVISQDARQWLLSSGICNYQLRYEKGLFTNSKFLPSYERETRQENCEKKFLSYTNYQSFKGNLFDTFNEQKQPLFALQVAGQYLNQLENLAKHDPHFNLDIIENFLQQLFDQMSDIKILTKDPSKYQKLLNASLPLLEIRKSILYSLKEKPDDQLFRRLTDVLFIIVQSLKSPIKDQSLDNESVLQILKLSELVLEYTQLDEQRSARIFDMLDSLFVICNQDTCRSLIEKLYGFLIRSWSKT